MATNITSPKLKSGGFILNETLPGSCVIDTSAEGLRNSSNGIQCYSLTLYKDQFFRCSLMNFTTKTFHYEPCSSYSIYLLPKTGDSFQHKFSLEWNFTTPLDPSGIFDFVARNITSYSYELQWHIPAWCRTLATINITINNASQVLEKKNLYQECDAKQCRVSWKSELLIPCTRYFIKVGENSINVTTYPDERDLKPSASISAHRNGINHNELEWDIELFKVNPMCATLVDSVQVGFANTTIYSMGPIQIPRCTKSLLNEKLVCKGKYTVNQLNLCKTHQVDIRLIYSDSLFSDKSNSISINLTPTTSANEKKFTFIRVEQFDPQTFILEWNNDCLMGNISYWNVSLQNQSGIVQLLHIPHGCSREFTMNDTMSNSSSLHRGYRIVLSRGQVSCSSTFLNTYGRVLNLLPCSPYTIRVTPNANDNVLTEFSQEVNFTTIYHREGEENLRPQLTVSVARVGASNLTMSISLNGKIHPSCASSLKEIQVFHNESRSSPYILPCSSNNDQRNCSNSFSLFQFDLCRSYSIQLRLVFNNLLGSELFNSTLEQAVEGKAYSGLEIMAVATTNPEALAIQWEDPCSLTEVGEWQIAIKPSTTDTSKANHKIDDLFSLIRDAGVTVINETLPASCIIEKSARIESNNSFRYFMILYKDQPFRCQSTNYTTETFHYDPCNNYSIELDQKASASYHPKLYLKTNFSTPIDSSAVWDLRIRNVTSDSYELQWTIPARCQALPQIAVRELNNHSDSFVISLNRNNFDQDCDAIKCRVYWKSQSLTPCARYFVSVGTSSINVTTHPDDGELQTSVSIGSSQNNDEPNELELDVVLFNMSPACTSLVDSISVGFANQTISMTGTSQVIDCNTSPSFDRVVCKGKYLVNQLNLCEAHSLEVLPNYMGSLFSEKVQPISTRTTPLFLQKSRIVRVDQRDSQTFLIEWNVDDCLIANISQWDITIDSALNESRILQLDFPYSCSTESTDDKRNGSSNGRQHSVILSRGQVTCNTTSLKTYGRLTDIVPCSHNIIRVTPSTRTMKLIEFGTGGNFTTFYHPDAVHNLTVVNVTSTSFEISWIIPSQCPDSTQKSVQVNGETKPLNLSDIDVHIDGKWKEVRWRNPTSLLPCMVYRVQVESSVINISTSIDFVTGRVNNMTVEIINSTLIDIRWDPPTCERPINYWRLLLWSDSDNSESSSLVNFTLPSTILSYTINITINNEPIRMGNESMDDDWSLLILESCQIYHIDVVTEWADGSSYKVEETAISTECPPSLITFWTHSVVLGVIIILSSLGFIIFTSVGVGVYYFRIRRKREEADNSFEFRVVELTTYS